MRGWGGPPIVLISLGLINTEPRKAGIFPRVLLADQASHWKRPATRRLTHRIKRAGCGDQVLHLPVALAVGVQWNREHLHRKWEGTPHRRALISEDP